MTAMIIAYLINFFTQSNKAVYFRSRDCCVSVGVCIHWQQVLFRNTFEKCVCVSLCQFIFQSWWKVNKGSFVRSTRGETLTSSQHELKGWKRDLHVDGDMHLPSLFGHARFGHDRFVSLYNKDVQTWLAYNRPNRSVRAVTIAPRFNTSNILI